MDSSRDDTHIFDRIIDNRFILIIHVDVLQELEVLLVASETLDLAQEQPGFVQLWFRLSSLGRGGDSSSLPVCLPALLLGLLASRHCRHGRLALPLDIEGIFLALCVNPSCNHRLLLLALL